MIDYELFDSLVDQVCTLTRISEEELFEPTRKAHLVEARYILYFLAKQENFRLTSIGRYMKSRGFDVTHATILYGVKQMKEAIKENPENFKLSYK